MSTLKRRLKLRLRPTANINGVLVPVDQCFSEMMQDILYCGVYESGEYDILSRRLEKDDIVFEVGAGIGFLSAFSAMRIGSERVFAYEANPGMERHIQATYRLNNVSPQMRIGILGEGGGTTTFYTSEHFWASSAKEHADGMKAVEVQRIDVKEELTRIKPTMLVMDIEGGEYDLLRLMDLSTFRKLLIELHPTRLSPEELGEIDSKIANAGFELVEKMDGEAEYSAYYERR